MSAKPSHRAAGIRLMADKYAPGQLHHGGQVEQQAHRHQRQALSRRGEQQQRKRRHHARQNQHHDVTDAVIGECSVAVRLQAITMKASANGAATPSLYADADPRIGRHDLLHRPVEAERQCQPEADDGRGANSTVNTTTAIGAMARAVN